MRFIPLLIFAVGFTVNPLLFAAVLGEPVRIDFERALNARVLDNFESKLPSEFDELATPLPDRSQAYVDTYRLLFSQKFEALDKALSKAQAEYERDSSKREISSLLGAFEGLSLGHTYFVDLYAQAFPNSYVANTARGIVWAQAAWTVRTGKFTAEIPKWRMERMQEYGDKAIEALAKARVQSLKPTYALMVFESIAAPLGKMKEAQIALADVEKLDAGNDAYWDRKLARARPQWGGSAEQMEIVARKALAAGKSKWAIYAKNEIIELQERERAGGKLHANQRITLTSRFLDTDRSYANLTALSIAHAELEKYDIALKFMDEALELWPTSTSGLYRRGWTYTKLGQHQNAMKNYIRAAQFGHYNAIQVVGAAVMFGQRGRKADFLNGMQWCKFGASIGHGESMECVARSYLVGDNMKKDANKALDWYLRAAFVGVTSSRYEAGALLIDGSKVPANQALGVSLLQRATQSDFKPAVELLKKIGAPLPSKVE